MKFKYGWDEFQAWLVAEVKAGRISNRVLRNLNACIASKGERERWAREWARERGSGHEVAEIMPFEVFALRRPEASSFSGVGRKAQERLEEAWAQFKQAGRVEVRS